MDPLQFQRPLWKDICKDLDENYRKYELIAIAEELNISVKDKNKNQLCKEIAQHYAKYLEQKRLEQKRLEQKRLEQKRLEQKQLEEGQQKPIFPEKKCINDFGDLLGSSWDEIPEEDIIKEGGYCFSMVDLAGLIKRDSRNPYTRQPLSQKILKEYRLRLKRVDKGPRIIFAHEPITGTELSYLTRKLAEVIDTNEVHSDSRNYFDIGQLRYLAERYGYFDPFLINLYLLTGDNNVKTALMIFIAQRIKSDIRWRKSNENNTFSFKNFLEILINVIFYLRNIIPIDDLQNFKLLIKALIIDTLNDDMSPIQNSLSVRERIYRERRDIDIKKAAEERRRKEMEILRRKQELEKLIRERQFERQLEDAEVYGSEGEEFYYIPGSESESMSQ